MLRQVASASLALWLLSASAQPPGAQGEPCVPVWVDAAGRPTPDARDALALLRGAAADGLDPLDYDAPSLVADAARLGGVDAPRPVDRAAFDSRLSANTLTYLHDLHFGRIDPSAVGFRIPARSADDLAERLRAAVAGHRVPALAAELTPSLTVYRELRGALARYRALSADPALRSFTLPAMTIHPGEHCAELPALRHYLAALGDLPPGAAEPAEALLYGGAVVDAVRHFQARHGLVEDGVLGQTTRAALSVPLSWRTRQIELSLERLRWLPELGRQRILAVNIPMFRVWGMEGEPSARTASFSSQVIVGRALNTRTPVLIEQMDYVMFRPYWNVPPSILRNEILPAMRRDPDYLRRHNMEAVPSGNGFRVRQRPGPTNSLGLVKFVFPNDDNVYMHGTPAPELFNRPRRDLSHGCIRVADPVGLAVWVLADQPEWTRERILAAMDGPPSTQVALPRPIPVILFYLTAVVTPADGALHFAEDIYGHDARLDRYWRQ
jgi:murein L,D-transpeptidase YcbB/YkuD